jgi:chromosomal replication initiation ATPase DnaA
MYSHIIDQLILVCSKYFSCTEDEIKSPCRKQHLVQARNIIADIAYKEYLFTYQAIGSRLNRNHSTILYNLDNFYVNYKTDTRLKSMRKKIYENVENNLHNSLKNNIFA